MCIATVCQYLHNNGALMAQRESISAFVLTDKSEVIGHELM